MSAHDILSTSHNIMTVTTISINIVYAFHAKSHGLQGQREEGVCLLELVRGETEREEDVVQEELTSQWAQLVPRTQSRHNNSKAILLHLTRLLWLIEVSHVKKWRTPDDSRSCG